MTIKGQARSAAKAFTWRIIASIDTFTIAIVATSVCDSPQTAALAIAAFEVPNKLILYYLHERLWAWLRRRQERKEFATA